MSGQQILDEIKQLEDTLDRNSPLFFKPLSAKDQRAEHVKNITAQIAFLNAKFVKLAKEAKQKQAA